MKKTLIILGVLVVLSLSVIANGYYEKWNSNVRVKNIPTLEFSDQYIIDLIDEDIIKERNYLKGSGYTLFTDEEDIIQGKFDYHGWITTEFGEIEYRLKRFEEDYVDINEYDTSMGGDGILEYELIVKKKIPVYAEFWTEDKDYANVRIEGEDFYYEGELEDGDFIRNYKLKER